jgi:hypothetical protein
MGNPEKLGTLGRQDQEKHKMCWTPLYANKQHR